jgi:hypothetical protein
MLGHRTLLRIARTADVLIAQSEPSSRFCFTASREVGDAPRAVLPPPIPARALRRPAIDLPGDLVRAEDWFEETRPVDLQEAWLETIEIDLRKRVGWLKLGALVVLVIASAIAFAYSSGDRPARPQPAITPAPTPKVAVVPDPVAAPAPPVAAPAPPKPAAIAAPVRAARSRSTAQGILMISSKPPCTIVIDGARTGLVTPQRSIPLRSGTHRIMLVNEERHISDAFEVAISPQRPTKIVHDFMKP